MVSAANPSGMASQPFTAARPTARVCLILLFAIVRALHCFAGKLGAGSGTVKPRTAPA